MPRIDPLKLLVCLSVLLAPNGGIRSANEVKRLANLMAKFSKKLVSKCIYIQILKCTETELLGQFMAAGGWSLVHMWLADGITTKNWPLIQELLELLLCCPVDVERLKSNTAPKLVKTLSKDSTHEGVRLLASKLVEQWLKIARNDIRSGQQQSQSSSQSTLTTPSSSLDDTSTNPEKQHDGQDALQEVQTEVVDAPHEEVLDETFVEDEQEVLPETDPLGISSAETIENGSIEEDSEGKPDDEDVAETKKAFNDAVAESNDKKTPLLFKITMKNGKQVLAKVESPTKKTDGSVGEDEDEVEKDKEGDNKDNVKEDNKMETIEEKNVPEVELTDSTESVNKSDLENAMKDEKKESEVDTEKSKDRRKSDEKERSKDSRDKGSSKDKDKHRDKDRDKKSSGSSHRSSSSKSSTSSSSSSKHNSSSSKSKSSSSSSSSKSSTSNSSSRDKDRHNSSNSSNSSSSKHHHKSSSSSKSSGSSKSSSSSSSEKHREHKDKSSHSSKDKDSKLSSPSSSKVDKSSKKSKDGSDERLAGATDDIKASPGNTKKASISIEVRNSEHRPKTVKTFNSQFRSHGLIEEAPPPPSRKGLKKPPTTPTVIGSTATGTVHHSKRASPPPSSKEGPPEKKAREEPADRPGAIKLIPPKRQPSLIESDMFMDALSATLKKDVKKRKRKLSGSEQGKQHDPKSPATPTTPTTPTAPTPDKTPIIAKAVSPEKSILPSPPTSPKADNPPATTQVVPVAGAPTSPVPAEPSSPSKVVVAPMSFYRDTLADTEELAEIKKELMDEKKETEEVTAPVEGEEIKSEAIPETPAEPDDDDEDDIIMKPKRLKCAIIDDDEGDDKTNLVDSVSNDVAKKMEEELPEKKLPGPGCGPDGPPGVLVIHRRKGPKKQLKWKAQEELEEVRYFELDVTERCNVTRTFTDLKHMERVDERNKYMLARKVNVDDMMMERTPWLPLIVIDNVPPHPEGVNSQERRLQQNRERTVLQALYFNRHMIPDSPAEPDVEVYSISEPTHIPMDDVTGNPDSVNDFTNMPWPEPKSTPPHESAGFNSPFFPGAGNDFPSFMNNSNWDLPGVNPGPMPGMFPPGRVGQGLPPMGGNNGPPGGGPPMMRQLNINHNMPPNMGGPNMGGPHPNMFQNNFVRGPHPMQHINDREDENFRNGPPPPPAWFGGNNNNGGNNRGPPPHQSNFNNRSGSNVGSGGNADRFGGNRRDGGNWNNNRDHDRGGPRGGNYRPPWLSNNRGNQNNHRGGGRKW